MPKHIMTAMMSILLLLLAACASAATPSPDEIASQLQTALYTPMHGIMESTSLMPDGRQETSVIEMWHNGAEQTRTIILSEPEGVPDIIQVRNGNQMWLYDPSENAYFQIEPGGGLAEQTGGQMTQMVEQMLESMEMTYLGRSEVANRKTHELKFTPKEGEENPTFIQGETTISVDSETWYPLKMETQIEQLVMKMEYREIEFNPDFPPDTFTFVPPEGAKEVEMDIPLMQELTLEEVREKASFSLLEPTSLPKGFEFKGAQLFDMPDDEGVIGTSVILTYGNRIGQLTISQFNSPEGDAQISEMAAVSQNQKVTVRGQEGYLMDTGMGMRNLIWVENDLQLSIFGSLSEEEILKVAESLE